MAADKTTKILEVVVDNNKAVTAISEYNRLIAEQKALREAYIKEYRAMLRGILENTYIQRPDGTKEKIGKKES